MSSAAIHGPNGIYIHGNIDKDFANGRGEDTEEYILRLDLDQAMSELA